jgi:hypothetical protein
MAREFKGHMKSQNANRIDTFGKGSSGSLVMTYEEKVKLFNARRYLMPMLPEGTKNWIMRDFIRYIDENGKWYPISII